MAERSGEPQPRHIEQPRLQGGRLSCPRCERRLMSDGVDYICVACGYEFPADDLDRELRRALRAAALPRQARQAVMGLATGAVIGGVIGRGVGGLVLTGATAGAVLAAALIAVAVGLRARGPR